MGIWARVQFSDYMKLSSYDYSTACYVLIGTGVFVTLIGFLGCCGALKEQVCMLKSVSECKFLGRTPSSKCLLEECALQTAISMLDWKANQHNPGITSLVVLHNK